MEERSFSIRSNPVDRISSVREATQNQTRTLKTRKRVMPSIVMVRFANPMFALHTGLPAVKNRIGIEIIAAKSGISAVRVKKCLSGIREATAKISGIVHINAK